MIKVVWACHVIYLIESIDFKYIALDTPSYESTIMSRNFSLIVPGLKVYNIIYRFIDKYYHQKKILKYLKDLKKKNW